jgi:hypothetical protein
MSLKRLVVTLVSVLALIALPMSAAEDDLEGLEQFHVDGKGVLAGNDTSPQTLTVEGSFIGRNATLTWTFSNINVQGNMMLLPTENCAYKYGTATITATNTTDKIFMSLGGSGCAGAGSGPGQTSAAYWITGGAGKFLNSEGAGSFSWGFQTNGSGSPTAVHISGNILVPSE